MSECATSREIFAPYCVGLGVEAGFGGAATVPHVLTSDQKTPYTNVGGDKQIFQNDCRDFSFMCDGVLDFFVHIHLAEDFSYTELAGKIIPEWRRLLKPGGLLLTNCPDQKKFLAHCAKTGQGTNDAHLEQDFSLENWNKRVLPATGPWNVIFEEPNHGPYSFLQVIRKI
jgi:hypothetical protein